MLKIKEKFSNMNIKVKYTLVGIVFFLLGGVVFSGGVSQSKYDELNNLYNDTREVNISKIDEIKRLENTIKILEEKIDSASPWFKMNEEEQRKIDEENKRVEEEKRIADEKAKEEQRIAEEKQAEENRKLAEAKKEEERLAKEQSEKDKYETGIGYNDVARSPEKYMLQAGKFSGKVVQVIEGDTHNNLRVAVGGNYDNMLLVEYDPSILDVRILDNDQVTIYGTNMGTISYESTLGATITIPAMLADKIDIK